MKKKNLVMIIFAGVFISFGIITLAGMAFSAANIFKTNYNEANDERTKRGETIQMKTYIEERELTEIESIKIENTNLNIKISNSDDEKLYVKLATRKKENSPSPLIIKQEGSTITISAQYYRPNILALFTMKEQTLYIKIPAAYTGNLEAVKIAGNLSTEFDITNQLGKCQFSDCKGNIKFNVSDIKSLIAENVYGNLTIHSNITEALTIKKNHGNSKILGIGDKDCVVEISDLMGNLKLNYTNPAKTTITGSRGNIGITFENNDDILLMTERIRGNISGDYSMSREGVDFMLKDVMGNIKINSK